MNMEQAHGFREGPHIQQMLLAAKIRSRWHAQGCLASSRWALRARTSSNAGKIYTKFQEVVVGTSSPGSVALVVGAGEELVVDAYGLRTPDNI